ncbi:MAG TPA: group III truncated hemoglobin [Gemmatimonadaceae bacterium]|nr:group III truncated hemoglobin [Gemmatimonadaceae bacterium]
MSGARSADGRRPLPITDPGTGTTVAADAAGTRRDLRVDDLHDMLTSFYDTVALDPLLQPYFAPVDMSEHMPRIVDFWSTIVFHTGAYSGNAFRPHAEMPGLTGRHFTRWLAVMEDTIDHRFAGPAAENMKAMSHRIALSMQIRLRIEPFGDSEAMAG